MPRLARIDLAGVLQHVMFRGIEKRDIFADDHDRFVFVDRFSKLLVNTGTECIAWSLLSNHAHLLLRPAHSKLSQMMRCLLTGYAVAFNLRHHRCGHLFQNRYKSIVCEKDSYLLELVRYIHLNPFRAGMVSSLGQLDSYRWCGHAVIMEQAELPGQSIDEVLLMFDDNKTKAQKKYRNFIVEGMPLGKRNELVGGGLKRQLKLSCSSDLQAYDERILGSGEFVEQMWNATTSQLADETASSPPLQEIIERVASTFGIKASALPQGGKQKRLSDARSAICFIATKRFGYPGVQVAKALAMSRSGVILAAERGGTLFDKAEALRELYPAEINNPIPSANLEDQ